MRGDMWDRFGSIPFRYPRHHQNDICYGISGTSFLFGRERDVNDALPELRRSGIHRIRRSGDPPQRM